MKEKDELQLIQEIIECLEAVEARLRHRPEDKNLTVDIHEVVLKLKSFLQNAGKKNDGEIELWISRAISLLKLIIELVYDHFDNFIN